MCSGKSNYIADKNPCNSLTQDQELQFPILSFKTFKAELFYVYILLEIIDHQSYTL